MAPDEPKKYAPMNPLARLIRRRRDELGLSWPELAAKGGFTSHTIVYTLATKAEHKRPPRDETIVKLAKAIEVPVEMVRAAAAEACGFHVTPVTTTLGASTDIKIVAAIMDELSEADRQTLTGIAAAFAAQVARHHREERNGQ